MPEEQTQAQQPTQAQDQPREQGANRSTSKPRAASSAGGAKATKTKAATTTTQTDTAVTEKPARSTAAKRQTTSQAAGPSNGQLPPMEPSDEATAAQLKLAKAQGDAYAKALQAMDKESGAQTQRAGDYEIAVVAEQAEGMYHMTGGELQWMQPGHNNVHFEVAVRDAADGRFIPGLHVRIHVDKANGDHVGEGELPFIWHPWLYHYGQNWWVPEDGDYRIQVHVEPPLWHRHDKKNGQRYARPADVEFTMQVKTGQKRAD